MALIESIDREIVEAATVLGGQSDIRDDIVFVLADLLPFVMIAIAIGLFFSGKTKRRRERNRNTVLIGLAAVLVAVGIRFLIVNTASRPRPFVTYPDLHHVGATLVDAASFPSGHALYLFTFAGIVFFISPNRKLGWFLIILATVIAVSRVVAGVHYPTDILGGAVIGLLLAKVLSWQSKWVEREVR